jgi:hypothetical protein
VWGLEASGDGVVIHEAKISDVRIQNTEFRNDDGKPLSGFP